MKHVLFVGCSYVAGSGWELEQQDPHLWVNLLHRNTNLKQYSLINHSRGGRSNAGIFQDAVWNIGRYPIEYAFVSWTAMPRYELSLGLELYETRAGFMPNGQCFDWNLNDIRYSKKYLENIRDRFTTLPHLHFEILNLIYYVNALVDIGNRVGTKIFFVNSMCPWDQNYFTRLHSVLPNQYTKFTQKLINCDNRDDHEIFSLYDKLHNEYDQAGGIQESHWLNLYNSLVSQKVDVNSDGAHPGIKSNQLYYTQLHQALQSLIGS